MWNNCGHTQVQHLTLQLIILHDQYSEAVAVNTYVIVNFLLYRNKLSHYPATFGALYIDC